MYGQFRATVQEEVVRRIYHPEAAGIMPTAEKQAADADRAGRLPLGGLRARNLQAVHPSAMAAGQQQMEASTPGATKEAPQPVRVKKTPGRNDPCWCGSGKKYKYCHLKSDTDGGNGSDGAEASTSARPGSKRKKRMKARKR
jgi:uncharacterized protein YchJ